MSVKDTAAAIAASAFGEGAARNAFYEDIQSIIADGQRKAETAGFRRGIEAAADWHDAEAQICERESERKYRESYLETSEVYQTHAKNHRFAAKRIRALLPADKETSDGK